ncbi:dihydrolipoamide acetyltransferase family protein [Halalkalibacterium halodurans]|uniref:Dihydrolipoamide acetyltransferase component of pyruvate dehydrogenase complex n=1 Tax=Halalkalibacterium halodurans (strain ATCC BAA-125 / DSM 18197 / FERM 7344 / JCM 9153 / C-125) TaxID=272558 RepID=Q9KES1_HALH5|nr:dihydrolipoamide acetyltransferase family protein [Halalkalibacterium halodurans]MED4081447.1 dihydrolipoamide acetyltransferase family protein [Halalkalibacterium halodurans]MED4083271.1 dihydrolipoamide acetyltransferase family protein [Halalkalibacterium halodurans]MED4106538.1 dihydrolipoamide acetyltransferase family protein [Halalkalibacterium halodurans]MED4108773.1 dihydrolipoamide acetyltransferase family protein [Halalkalibacterium halodurans]MED4122666.1 dihydrolipoamide acetyltr
MAKEIFMPKLSSTMQEGTLLQWFKEEGDRVEVGEPLFEIMTDKINIEVEAYEEGTLLKRYYGEDDEIPVNHVIGYIGTPDESVPTEPPGASEITASSTDEAGDHRTTAVKKAPSSDRENVRATPAARRIAKEKRIDLRQVEGSGPEGRVQAVDVATFKKKGQKATPLAKKVAEVKGVALEKVQGSGPYGKVYREDVEHAQAASPVEDKGNRVKLSGLRKVVAKRMVDSAFSAPHVTITTEIDMSSTIKIRSQLLGMIEQETGYRLSYTEIVMKAVAHALMSHPTINASFFENEIVYHEDVHIGLAVAVEGGLVVPVVKHVDKKGLAQLTNECKTVAMAARDNRLSQEMMSGGTFTISNLGMYAIDVFTPVINQPESAILGVGRIQEKPVGIDGQIELRPMMTASLSFDHRVIDGAPAAAFLTDVKSMLEQPFQLLM